MKDVCISSQYSALDFPQLVFACFFLAPLDDINANEVAQCYNARFPKEGKVAKHIYSDNGIEAIGKGVDDCGCPLTAL
jgi:hypothetical protein